jgi:hypothetical protein
LLKIWFQVPATSIPNATFPLVVLPYTLVLEEPITIPALKAGPEVCAPFPLAVLLFTVPATPVMRIPPAATGEPPLPNDAAEEAGRERQPAKEAEEGVSFYLPGS